MSLLCGMESVIQKVSNLTDGFEEWANLDQEFLGNTACVTNPLTFVAPLPKQACKKKVICQNITN